MTIMANIQVRFGGKAYDSTEEFDMFNLGDAAYQAAKGDQYVAFSELHKSHQKQRALETVVNSFKEESAFTKLSRVFDNKSAGATTAYKALDEAITNKGVDPNFMGTMNLALAMVDQSNAPGVGEPGDRQINEFFAAHPDISPDDCAMLRYAMAKTVQSVAPPMVVATPARKAWAEAVLQQTTVAANHFDQLQNEMATAARPTLMADGKLNVEVKVSRGGTDFDPTTYNRLGAAFDALPGALTVTYGLTSITTKAGLDGKLGTSRKMPSGGTATQLAFNCRMSWH